ncbi:MAG: NAD-dependent epimerase/dehydratase family protein, partial [Pseudomonadota bacterium]
ATGADRIREQGFQAVVYDGSETTADLSEAIKVATHILVSAGPDAAGDAFLRYHEADILAAPHIKWIGYLSTIGVYGDQKGAWVSEETPPNPRSDRTTRRVLVELAWRATAHQLGCRFQCFRLAGIYGPGRSAIDKVTAGTARRIIKPGQVFNRIHVDDIATAVLAGMSGAGTQEFYNVSDDEPAPPQDVIAYAAELLGKPCPPDVPFEEAELSPMGRSFYSDLKRVKNNRLESDLGITLAYPTYREGLEALAAAVRQPTSG